MVRAGVSALLLSAARYLLQAVRTDSEGVSDAVEDAAALLRSVRLNAGSGCTKHKVGDVVEGYSIAKCLGAGGYGEAYAVNVGAGGTELVMKVGKIGSLECQFAKDMKSIAPESFTDCVASGKTSGMKEPYLVMEKAKGDELMNTLKKSAGEPPAQLATLLKVVETADAILGLEKQMVNHSHYMLDVHPGNIFMTAEGDLTIIDYGATYIGSNTVQVLNAKKMMGLWGFLNLALMLIDHTYQGMLPPMMGKVVFPTFSGAKAAEDADVAGAVQEIKTMMRRAYEAELTRSDAEPKLVALLQSGLAAIQKAATDWPPSWEGDLQALKAALS